MKLDVTRLLTLLGMPVRNFGSELRTHCPNPKHPRKPGPGSWQIRLTGERAGNHYCYAGCGFGGGPVDLVMAIKQLRRGDARRWLYAEFGAPSKHQVRLHQGFKADDLADPLGYPAGSQPLVRDGVEQVDAGQAIDYLRGRGLSLEDIEDFGILFVPPEVKGYGGRVIVPVIVQGEMVDFVARLYVERSASTPKALSGKRDLGARKELSLWGYDDVPADAPYVVVTEGLWGALAVRRALGAPWAVAACGSAWSPERTDLLAPWSRIILVPDGDAAGSKMANRASGLRFSHDLRMAQLPPGAQPDAPDLAPGMLIRCLDSATTPRYESSPLARAMTWEGK